MKINRSRFFQAFLAVIWFGLVFREFLEETLFDNKIVIPIRISFEIISLVALIYSLYLVTYADGKFRLVNINSRLSHIGLICITLALPLIDVGYLNPFDSIFFIVVTLSFSALLGYSIFKFSFPLETKLGFSTSAAVFALCSLSLAKCFFGNEDPKSLFQKPYYYGTTIVEASRSHDYSPSYYLKADFTAGEYYSKGIPFNNIFSPDHIVINKVYFNNGGYLYFGGEYPNKGSIRSNCTLIDYGALTNYYNGECETNDLDYWYIRLAK